MTNQEASKIYQRIRKSFMRKHNIKSNDVKDYGASPWNEMTEEAREFNRLLIEAEPLTKKKSD